MRTGTLSGFFARALLWLVLALVLWYPLRELLVLPAGWLAGKTMAAFFPLWVREAQPEGGIQVLLTSLSVRDASGRLGDLAPEATGMTFAYGAPLLAALLLASGTRRLWWKLPAGLLALLPFQAWGICFTWLMQVAVIAGPHTRGQTHFGVWETNLIAAGYQFGFLILPTLAPVLMWLAFDRRMIAVVMIEGALTPTRR